MPFFTFKCVCIDPSFASCDSTLQLLHFDYECELDTRTWQSIHKHFKYLRELVIPTVPPALIPLILKNKNYVQVLEVGQISNELVHIICHYCQLGLKSLTFDGSQITYSGIVGLSSCKPTIQELYIRNPKYLTKYSLHILSRILGDLRWIMFIVF